jgi:hypothetical protein
MPNFPPVTSEHLALSLEYEEKWRAIATRTKRIDQSRVRAAIQEIYQFLDMGIPTLEFVGSPYSAGLRLRELIESQYYAPLKHLRQEIQKKLKQELTVQLIGYTSISCWPAALGQYPSSELFRQLSDQVNLLGLEIHSCLFQSPQAFTTLQWNYQSYYIAPEMWACDV